MRLIWFPGSRFGYETTLSNEDCMPQFFGSFIPKLGDLDSRLEGCGTCHQQLVFQIC
jgi:hypothetical protein